MIVASANYSFLAIVEIAFRTLLPVFLSTPVALGGLGLDPPAIGTIMSLSGILNGMFTVFLFSRMTDYFGVKWMYLIGSIAAVPRSFLFPLMNYLARGSVEHGGGLRPAVWLVVGLQVFMAALNNLSYGTVCPIEVELSIELFPSIVRFRRSVHLHRRSPAKQGLFGGYDWTRPTVCEHRACCRTCPGELDILAVD